MSERLSQEDVDRLLSDPSAETRRITATKIARDFGSEVLTESEQKVAQEIIGLLVRDVAVRVRQALSEGLKHNPNVPPDVAVALSKDVDDVATPILRNAFAFSDDDLIEIIKIASPRKLAAIAERDKVSSRVSDALIDHGDENAVACLIANDGAEIDPQSLHRALDRYGESERVHEAMIDRSKLPLVIAERLVAMVSNQMRTRLVTRHELKPETATELMFEARERATMALLSPDADAREVHRLVDQLYRFKRLTPTMVLRALCTGDVVFFESAITRLAGIPEDNVRILVGDTGGIGLKRLYDKAGLPASMFPLARSAIELYQEMQRKGMPDSRDSYARLMLERIVSKFDDLAPIAEPAEGPPSDASS
ncbi:MAG: hypothetical protein CMM50_11300 [Rhodospirillaceae bacterium]|jgi:uncharacterized protein (DUF2336 family)|nr:hypothetical protein [Rhodospirillaceae bacterium]